jgi:dTDP-glucose pyrophosphorylase
MLHNKIANTSTLKQALEKLNQFATKDSLTLFVVNAEEKLVGAITDGDIRRALLKGVSLEVSINEVMNTNPRYIQQHKHDLNYINELKQKEIFLVPVVDESQRLIKIVDLKRKKSLLPIDVVLMAGGEGKRLMPLTNKTPKPMLLIGDKPIIETNINRLNDFGADNFYLSVNYLADVIKSYFKDGSEKQISIQYLEEKTPLGTIGSVSLCQNFKHDAILVMNSDLLTNIDFEDFYYTFKEEDADFAVACIPYQVSLPYGVIETNGKRVVQVKEKPTYTYYSNAGIYLFKKSIVDLIPKNEFFSATDLIEKLIAANYKVVNYSLLNYWLDIGKHEDFSKAQEDIKHLKL